MASTIEINLASAENVQLVEGKKFASFKELLNFIQKYEEMTQQTFVRSNSRSLKNAQVRKVCKPELVFFEVNFKCVHGKLQHASQATGLRNSWTSKLNCNSFIKIHASDDGQYLEIIKFNTEHNHKGTETFHKLLPKNRKLQSCEQEEVINLLKLRSDKKFIQEHAREKFGKHLSMKDIHNLASNLTEKDDDSLSKTVEVLQETYERLMSVQAKNWEGETTMIFMELVRDKYPKTVATVEKHTAYLAIIEIVHYISSALLELFSMLHKNAARVAVLHENKVFKGLYFSTKQMRDDMDSWPEIVFIDGTYKLLKRNLTVMILLVEDSMGLSKVVGVALLAREDRPTFQWFLNSFKEEHVTTWLKMQCMMGDKDLNERDVLKEIFPNIPIYICLFHSLRTFGRQVTKEKMDITTDQRTRSLEFLNCLAKSTSEKQYDNIYEKFCNEVPEVVSNYFNKNWHPIRHEWTKYSMVCGNLGNLTNNRLESVNSKIKQMVKKHSTMVAFVHSFFKWLNNREHEMLNKVSKNFLKKKVTAYESGGAEHQYMQQLTSYAFSVVEKEISQHKAITIRKSDYNLQTCIILACNVDLTVTPVTCECSTFKSMFLPCRHIFAARRLFNLPLFTEELCSDRWKKSYALQSNSLIQHNEKVCQDKDPNLNKISISQCIAQKNYSDTQKRNLLKMVTNDIVQMGMLSTAANFNHRLEVLHRIRDFWRQGHEVCIEKVNTKKDDQGCTPDFNYDSSLSVIEEQEWPTTVNQVTKGTATETLKLNQSFKELSIDDEGAKSSPIVEGNLDELVLPVPLKRRNRSKHADSTIVKYTKKKTRPINYSDRPPLIQAKILLQWVVTEDGIINNALTGEYLIREKDIPPHEQELPESFLADEVDLSVLVQYFEKTAFLKLKKLVQQKKTLDIWTCRTCKSQLGERSIFCDSCLCWYDYKCVGLKQAPKAKRWYCSGCTC